MSGLSWNPAATDRLAAIRDDLARVSTATAFHMLFAQGWRDTYLRGVLPLTPLGLGVRLVGRARTCQYLVRRGPVAPFNREQRRRSPEIVLIESLEPGDIFCVDALGVPTSGIIGDILATRIQAQGALAAAIHGAVRDTPYLKQVGLPVFASAFHPAASSRDLAPVAADLPVNMGGCQVVPGDILLADDEGVLAMPLELAEYVAAHGPAKEDLESWIRSKVEAGGSVHDYYPPTPEKEQEYTSETGRPAPH